MLDEVDQIEDKAVLNDFYSIRGIELVLIANGDDELLASINDRVASRLLSATRIRFGKYGTDELVAIFEDRVQWGLHEDAVPLDHLFHIAEKAAGDAQAAIGTLRAAARHAQQEGGSRNTEGGTRRSRGSP